MIKSFALWLYTNAERLEAYLAIILDGIGLLLGLFLCVAFFILGGAL